MLGAYDQSKDSQVRSTTTVYFFVPTERSTSADGNPLRGTERGSRNDFFSAAERQQRCSDGTRRRRDDLSRGSAALWHYLTTTYYSKLHSSTSGRRMSPGDPDQVSTMRSEVDHHASDSRPWAPRTMLQELSGACSDFRVETGESLRRAGKGGADATPGVRPPRPS